METILHGPSAFTPIPICKAHAHAFVTDSDYDNAHAHVKVQAYAHDFAIDFSPCQSKTMSKNLPCQCQFGRFDF